MTWLARFPLKMPLEDPIQLSILTSSPMTNATPVKRTDADTSLTKAVMCFGLRQSQQQRARVSIWGRKHYVPGCLA